MWRFQTFIKNTFNYNAPSDMLPPDLLTKPDLLTDFLVIKNQEIGYVEKFWKKSKFNFHGNLLYFWDALILRRSLRVNIKFQKFFYFLFQLLCTPRFSETSQL